MYRLGLVLNKVTKINSHVCKLARTPGPVCLQGREQEANGGDNLSCSVCTEELVISLLFIPFYYQRYLHILFEYLYIEPFTKAMLLSSLYVFWQCNPRTPVTVFQLQSSHHKSVTTSLQFQLLCWVQLGHLLSVFLNCSELIFFAAIVAVIKSLILFQLP